MKSAMFTMKEDIYYPANKNAIAACAIMSKMRLRKGDMLYLPNYGYEPILTSGQAINRVDVRV